MKSRCLRKTCTQFPRYWWRWIKICGRRKESFQNFMEDMFPSYEEWLSLDRIENDWDYCPENCRRATWSQQARNRSNNKTINWKKISEREEETWKTVSERSKLLWIARRTLYRRIAVWMTFKEATSKTVKWRYFPHKYKGMEKTLRWRAERSWINIYTLRNRVAKWKSIEEALQTN